MYCTRLAVNTGCKQSPKICHLGTIAQLSRAVSSQLRHISTIGKKLVRHQYLPLSSQYGERRPTNGWDQFTCLGHPSKFQQDSRIGCAAAATSLTGGQPNFARCLAISWAGTLCVHFSGFLPCSGILPGAKFTLRPKLPPPYFDSVTAHHSSSGVSKTLRRWTEGASYIRQGGHHIGIGRHSSCVINH